MRVQTHSRYKSPLPLGRSQLISKYEQRGSLSGNSFVTMTSTFTSCDPQLLHTLTFACPFCNLKKSRASPEGCIDDDLDLASPIIWPRCCSDKYGFLWTWRCDTRACQGSWAFDVIDGQTHRRECCVPLLLCSFMSQQPIVFLGDGNIAGTNLNNVGNRTLNIFGSQRDNGTLLLRVNLCDCF